MSGNDLAFYQALPYVHKWETRDEDGLRYFTVRLVEIPCVVGGGRTKDQALRAMRSAFEDYVAWRLEDGLSIAMPRRVLARRFESSIDLTPRPVTNERRSGSFRHSDQSHTTKTKAQAFRSDELLLVA